MSTHAESSLLPRGHNGDASKPSGHGTQNGISMFPGVFSAYAAPFRGLMATIQDLRSVLLSIHFRSASAGYTQLGNTRHSSTTLSTSPAIMLFGYDQGVLGAVISLDSFNETFDHPNDNLKGIFASIYDIGCFAGALLAFFTAERFGRKGSIVWGTWIMALGTILQTSASEKIQMIASRVITGIGNGINTCAVPMWQAESFKSHNRGALLVIQSALIAFGHPLSTAMGLASSQAEPSTFAWRWPIAVQGIFVVAILCILPFLPESPRWLVQHDRVEEATEIIARLEGSHASITDRDVVRDRDAIVASVEQERAVGEASWAEVFTEGKMRNLSRVLLGAGPYMYVFLSSVLFMVYSATDHHLRDRFNQWSGINSLAYYLPLTFEGNIGLSKQLSLIISLALGLQYFALSWLPYFFIERAGRRKILMWSAGACSFCMIMISIMLKINTKASNWVFVAFVFIFFDVFSWGILPVSWMYASEIMPLRTRNKGVALGVGSHWLSNFVVVYVTPQAITNLKYKLYIIWAVLNASFVPITYFFYPETARRSLEEMDEVFLNERFGVTKCKKPGPKFRASSEGSDSDLAVEDKEAAVVVTKEHAGIHE
ncbi:MAG: hypothetical protein M1836_002685 [Candelina mexicana]|nr:MAG: hypothetical protein M1836_002685 [Candelina mexicana]